MSSNLNIQPAGKPGAQFIIRQAVVGDIPAAMALVRRVFNLYVAGDFSQEGVNTFLSYVTDPEAVLKRFADHFILLAEDKDELAGMIEIRNYDHVSLLFVAPEYQNRGCASQLFKNAVQICIDHNPELSSISVNSSPFAVPVYRRLGFEEISAEMTVDGIRFTKMMWHRE